MDINEYIASGIIERYVFDSVSPQEKKEVECMSHIYPEIAEEVKKLQFTFEQVALKTAEKPSDKVKQSIFEAIKNVEQESAEGKKEPKVVALQPEITNKRVLFHRIVATAAVFLLLVSIYIGKRLTDTTSQLTVAQENLDQLEQKVNTLNGETQDFKGQLAFLKDVHTKEIQMSGVPNHEGLAANIYWNSNSKQVYLDINNLPQTTNDKQYQLWAIVDNKPVDLGVFDVTDTKQLVAMKTIASAQAFAVTLEPKGGSVVPTMEQMYVIGNV
jgi:anti-sigma-K factor RskA